MNINPLKGDFSVCKLSDISEINFNKRFTFFAKTDEEISIVCKTEDVPKNTTEREDGFEGFRIEGILDFSLVGILSRISSALSSEKIGIFAISTYNTDYIFVKKENTKKALKTLTAKGFNIKKQ